MVSAGVELENEINDSKIGNYFDQRYLYGVNQENMLKSQALLPGVHYLSFDVDIPAKDTEGDYIGVIENMDDLDTDLTYKFYVGH